MDVRGQLRRIARGVADETRGAQRPFTAFYTLSPDPLYLRPVLPQLASQSDIATGTWTGSVLEGESAVTAFGSTSEVLHDHVHDGDHDDLDSVAFASHPPATLGTRK